MPTEQDFETLIKQLEEMGCTTDIGITAAIIKAWGRGLPEVLNQTTELPKRKPTPLYKADMKGMLSSYQFAVALEMIKRHTDLSNDYYVLISSSTNCLELKTKTVQVKLATKRQGASAWLVPSEELLARIKYYKKQKGFITAKANVDTGNLDLLLNEKVVQSLTPVKSTLPVCSDYLHEFTGSELATINNQSALLFAQEFARLKAKGNDPAQAYTKILFNRLVGKDPQKTVWLEVVTTDTVRMIKAKPKGATVTEAFTVDRGSFLKQVASWKALKLHKVEGNVTFEGVDIDGKMKAAICTKGFGTELTVLVPQGDEEFMNYQKLFPKSHSHALEVDSELFKEALDECLLLHKPRTEKRILLNFTAGTCEVEMQAFEYVDVEVPWPDEAGVDVMVKNIKGETVVRTRMEQEVKALHTTSVPLLKGSAFYSSTCRLALNGNFLLDCIAVQAASLDRMRLEFTDYQTPAMVTIDNHKQLPEVTWLLMPIDLK
ncbi:MAG: hypothetical protein U9Q38_01445 [Thermodesulfobacteriota bacterium]|nr:hypothetical protein [Thermodesulfobacteriota bacterium]